MRFYSTKNKDFQVDLKSAVLQSLPPDNGLYMPIQIPALHKALMDKMPSMSFQEIAFEVANAFLDEDFTSEEVRQIIDQAINFPAPVVNLKEKMHVLELWHGPSLAFKDFGARFMANVMSRLVAGESRRLTILVATSGDTGGAVASGFLGVDNVDVIILYPSGKVSPLQEKQLTTLGQNIRAIEVDGTFDDCQALVKQAFLDKEVNQHYLLSSANSINITRLIPQSFYYFEAFKQIGSPSEGATFCVPSGNFGNLTAGLLAKRMGLPIDKMIAATNANDIVPAYLKNGQYNPRPSVATISNAMDVGNPSNFRRMEDLYGHIWGDLKEDIVGYAYDDEVTRTAVKEIHDSYDYIMDPHGAVGYLAAEQFIKDHGYQKDVVVLETAHPSKFLPVMEPILGSIEVPKRLAILSKRKKVATFMDKDYGTFKSWLIEHAD